MAIAGDTINLQEQVARAFSRGDFAGLTNGCQQYLQRQPGDLGVFSLLIQALVLQGNATAAQQLVANAQAQNDNQQLLLEPQAWALLAQGQLGPALALLDQFLAQQAELLPVYLGKADALVALGQFDVAIALYNAVLFQQPANGEAFHNFGYALERKNRLLEAVGAYSRALQIKPDYPEAHTNLGNTLFSLGRQQEAIEHYNCAIAQRPDYPTPYNNRGNAYVSIKLIDRGVESLQQAIALRPDYAEAYNNLGFALQKSADYAAARGHLDRAVELNPNYAEAHNNLGQALYKLKDFSAAMESFERAISLRPEYAEAHWNIALLQLMEGDYQQGWSKLEWRWRRSSYQPKPIPSDGCEWWGESLAGKTLTVYVEQGFGDMFMLCRYLPLLIEAGAKVIFAAPQIVHRLLGGLSDQLLLQGHAAVASASDYYTTLFSLPARFKTELATIPWRGPYLFAEPQLVEQWRQKIGSGGFKVALVWQGNPRGDVDLGRSLPLAALAPLAGVEGVRLISAQYEHGLEQLEQLPAGMQVEVLAGFNERDDGFVDTAAVMQCVDLVITTDTASANLAGALGVPVWTLLMEVPDWRWLMERSDSPWFPTMRLFRQCKASDWASVVEEVKTALQERVAQPSEGAAER